MFEKLDSIEERDAVIAALDSSFGVGEAAVPSVNLNPQFEDLSNPETIINHVQELKKSTEHDNHQLGLFNIRTANEWLEEAKHSPIPHMLFGELWHENELCILFADTNLGKSILAVQIGNSISKGELVEGFKLEAQKQPVLYFDFELSAKQFEVRYSTKHWTGESYENHYSFDPNFKRVEINPDAEIPEKATFEDFLHHSLEQSIIETGAKVLIIDNMTYLKNETEKAKDALPLMKHLKALKSKYNLSILALAHTPKRDLSKPISRNDLQGSKMLINFADSCFSIGESTSDKSIRYIKQIKARNTEIIYDTTNVMTCQIQKQHNFLEFQFLDFGTERQHLKKLSDIDWEERKTEVLELKNQGMSNTVIGKKYGVSEGAVRKWVKKFNSNE